MAARDRVFGRTVLGRVLGHSLSLKELTLCRTEVTDLSPLYGRHRRAELRVSTPSVTEDQVKVLKRKLPNCNVLTFDDSGSGLE